ncbi:MAG: hypothetical protein GOMPHAMPRED_006168 [Gomphillus americanus]|uniref:HECT-type E3 ubiquitin transferase n=1 Tax=Gomphillus americanus TaxID=1940652 RepID=A0A8H3EM63_9LECA|nr:MAG: hypothetical protein GOMPHAMPRED_006168 [Gomphillus americanus]
MFQTFSGSSRRPRQVNLSGRNNNPFSAIQSTGTSHNLQSSAVQQAQQDRKARQQERERLEASKTIQRTWREYQKRVSRQRAQRAEWDGLIRSEDPDVQAVIRLLLQFAAPYREKEDIDRILKAGELLLDRFSLGDNTGTTSLAKEEAALGNKLLEVFAILMERDVSDKDEMIITSLQRICEKHTASLAVYSIKFFRTLVQFLRSNKQRTTIEITYNLMNTMLRRSPSDTVQVYEGIVALLPNDWLFDVLVVDNVALYIDPMALALALERYLLDWTARSTQSSTWLLANYIYLHKKANKDTNTINASKDNNILASRQPNDVSSYSAQIHAHIRSVTHLMGRMVLHPDDHNADNENLIQHPFVQEQLETLVDQDKINSLLAHFEVSGSDELHSADASPLASYVLTLIQMFPRRSDEIRMWIYLGSTNSRIKDHLEKIPAIKFFWQAITQTRVFKEVSGDPSSAVKLIKSSIQRTAPSQAQVFLEQEWKICLLFLELYTFVLKVMDDDEFMSGGRSDSSYKSWTRESALPLSEVKALVSFLKNLAFAMYWNAGDLTSDDKPYQTTNLTQYFSTTTVSSSSSHAGSVHDALVVRGLQSSSINYTKSTVTGLLRMLYERDSRRQFLPDGQWLMPQVEMSGFMQAVLEEQRHKDQHNEAEDEEDDEMDIDDEFEGNRDMLSLVGSRRTRYIRRVEQIRKQQQRVMKRRKLEDALPRLNILENMPFFIPFNVRVQIFRQFVKADQEIRRNGYIDPDLWRMSVMHTDQRDPHSGEQLLRSRSARVRREHVMEDAYEQFFALGDGLKEPIQITFVDQFDQPEAGIDGGGVTKEFLTSVSEEAFKKGELKLFKENNQHLLYPNPVLIEEEKVLLRQADVQENGREWQTQLREILSRYEFIGRIVGKCLYEGILIDVHFAPFFLVKWALTGGHGVATNESGYRATINDLRDLDEELYKGLLDLKNYAGNVEDFALDFTITDEISTEDEPLGSIKVTSNLRPDGAATPVTNENKLVYISYVARHRLQVQPRQQTSAFLRGLGTMIQPSWLSMFNQSELQTLIGGDSSEIDLADLRRNTLYGGIYQIGDDGLEHPTVKLFWDVIRDLPEDDRRRFLKYVTSTPRAPLLGFSQLRPPFSIRDSGSDQQRLPSASTCVNLLKLPIYKKKEVLREKLLYAITSGAGFDLS